MNKEFIITTLGWVIPSMITILGICLQSILSDHFSNKHLKREYIYKIYDKRIEAYQGLYTELVRYRRLFAPVASDVIAFYNHESFDYTTECENIYLYFIEREIYFDEELIEIFKVLIVNNKIIADYLPVNKEAEANIDNYEIVSHASETIGLIDKCLFLIKDALGIAQLDKVLKK